jgi:hypothetical protein
MSVRNRELPAGNQRVFGATVIASVMMFGVACHNGVETPISPSTTTESVPAATSADLDADGATATTRGGPISFAMNEMPGAAATAASGFSGTCTLGPGGAGFRVKSSGQGVPGRSIRFILEIMPNETYPSGGRYTDFAVVDNRGNYKTGGERVTYIPSGSHVYCALLPEPGAGILAQSEEFMIP